MNHMEMEQYHAQWDLWTCMDECWKWMYFSKQLEHLLMLAESYLKMNSWLSSHHIPENDLTQDDLFTAHMRVRSYCSEMNIIINDIQTMFLTDACLHYIYIYDTENNPEYFQDDGVPMDIQVHQQSAEDHRLETRVESYNEQSTECQASQVTIHPEIWWDLWTCMDDCWTWMDYSRQLEHLLMLAESYIEMNTWLSQHPVHMNDLTQDDLRTAHMRVRSYCSDMNIIVNDIQTMFLTDACLYYVNLYYKKRSEPYMSKYEVPDTNEQQSAEEHSHESRKESQHKMQTEKRQTVEDAHSHPQSENIHLQPDTDFSCRKLGSTPELEGINKDINIGKVYHLIS